MPRFAVFLPRFAPRRLLWLSAALCAALAAAQPVLPVSAAAQETAPLPGQKPRRAAKAARERQALPSAPAAAPEAEERGGQRPRLGVIEEQSPLLLPPRNDAFAPPEPPPAAPPPAGAKPAQNFTTADYPLSENVLARLEKIHAEILALPDSDDGDDADDEISGGPDALAKALEKHPQVMSVLGRNLMSARDYVLASQAAANALAAAADVSDSKISAANRAFGKKYAERLRKLLEE